MAELTPQGDKIGDLFPVRVTELTRTANVRDAIELLYYGNLSGHSLTAGQEDQIPTQSIAGQFRDIGLTKLDKTSGVALGNFTVSNGSSPFIWLQGTTYKHIITGTPSGSDKTITLQNASGTLAFTNETQFTGLISIDSRTDSHALNLAYGNVVAGNTKTVNLGTGASSVGSTVVNIGASAGSSKVVNVYGNTTVNGTLDVSSTLAMNNNKVAGLADGTASGDAVNKGQLDTVSSAALPLAGGTMSGNINLGNNYLLNVKASGAAADGATVGQVNARLAASSNLSDVPNKATARSNLGLGTAATTAASAYATAAQGTKADNALPAYRIQAGYATVGAPGGPYTVAYPIFGAGQPVVVATPVENASDKWVVVGNVGTDHFTYRTNVSAGSLISWIAVFP